jgi:hypothetical protein
MEFKFIGLGTNNTTTIVFLFSKAVVVIGGARCGNHSMTIPQRYKEYNK